MLKWFIILSFIGAFLKITADRLWDTRNARNADRDMPKIVADLNRKLPETHGNLRIEKVEYADKVFRYSGTLLGGRELTDAEKSDTQARLRNFYCGNPTIRSYKVDVEYAFQTEGLRSINDKVKDRSWSTRVRSGDCT